MACCCIYLEYAGDFVLIASTELHLTANAGVVTTVHVPLYLLTCISKCKNEGLQKTICTWKMCSLYNINVVLAFSSFQRSKKSPESILRIIHRTEILGSGNRVLIC